MKYITILEYAKAANLTKYKAYQFWEDNKDKNNGIAVESGGVKYIDYDLLENHTENDSSRNVENIEKTVSRNIENDFIEYLKKQIADKDRQIEDLKKQIAEYTDRLAALNETSQTLADKALQIASQAQVLQLEQQTKKHRNILKLLFGKNKIE